MTSDVEKKKKERPRPRVLLTPVSEDNGVRLGSPRIRDPEIRRVGGDCSVIRSSLKRQSLTQLLHTKADGRLEVWFYLLRSTFLHSLLFHSWKLLFLTPGSVSSLLCRGLFSFFRAVWGLGKGKGMRAEAGEKEKESAGRRLGVQFHTIEIHSII